MTSVRRVEHHAEGLRDIRAILNSMKSLAFLEVQKLSRIVPAQRAVSALIDTAAADLLWHYPEIMPPVAMPGRIFIALGTERGFCGNHNQKLLERLTSGIANTGADNGRIIAVGRKLHAVLQNSEADRRVLLDGAGVAEEAQTVLDQIVDQLRSLRSQIGPSHVSAVYYDNEAKLRVRELLPPPFRHMPAAVTTRSTKPFLNLEPQRLLLDLSDQSLFSSLFEILYESLLTENQRRVQHLSDAVRHLDKETSRLARRVNSLRQEQITEEIEVLLLSSGPGKYRRDRASPRTRDA